MDGMTERLYYDHPYLKTFEAKAVMSERREDGVWLLLDRSAFYPTGGGQPHDTGRIRWETGSANVCDVEADARGVFHRLDGDGPLPGMQVQGEIDWPRRFDHMQQHGGEHLLAGAIWRLLGGRTIGLHLGEKVSTIDVEMPHGAVRLSAGQLDALENEVNARIQQNVPCRCWFPTPQELASLPLRKPPTVTEHVRVVAFGDFEYCACGGTHPAASGEIGFVKIVETLPARGKARVAFVCGMRAVRFAQERCRAGEAAARLLSCPPEQLPAAMALRLEAAQREHAALKALRRESALRELPPLLQAARPLPGGGRLVVAALEEADRDTLRDAAGWLAAHDDVIALLSAPQAEARPVLFARGARMREDMAALLRACGAKGGGRDDFAEGSALSEDCLQQAAARLLSRDGETNTLG